VIQSRSINHEHRSAIVRIILGVRSAERAQYRGSERATLAAGASDDEYAAHHHWFGVVDGP